MRGAMAGGDTDGTLRVCSGEEGSEDEVDCAEFVSSDDVCPSISGAGNSAGAGAGDSMGNMLSSNPSIEPADTGRSS